MALAVGDTIGFRHARVCVSVPLRHRENMAPATRHGVLRGDDRIYRIPSLHLVNPVNPVLLLPRGYDGPLVLCSRGPGASEWVHILRRFRGWGRTDSICANLRNLWTTEGTRKVSPMLFNEHALCRTGLGCPILFNRKEWGRDLSNGTVLQDLPFPTLRCCEGWGTRLPVCMGSPWL